MSSHLPIDPRKFELLCKETLEIYTSNYNWYYMPATLHKILIHGPSIIENSILPVGMLAEEASEARNKHYKNYREFHSRGHSRKATMEDMYLRAMDTSDPKISTESLRARINKNKKLPLPSAVLNVLAIPETDKQNKLLEDGEENDDDEDESELQEVFRELENVELLNESVSST